MSADPDPNVKLTPEQWLPYDAFNAAIAEEFFGGACAGSAVYLDLEVDTLQRISARARSIAPEAAIDTLVAAVRPTLQVASDKRLFGRHRQRRLSWRLGSRATPPPHLAILALLSLVAESMRGDGDLSANAYYARLIEMIGGDPGDEASRKQVIKAHRDDVVAMWRELNDWLERDPSRGLPTAYAFDHRTYIGPALTQALVREADRRAFPHLFATARLVPGQALEQADMVRLLEEWLPKSGVSRGLRTMCQRRSTLEQVAEVALAELRSWDGATSRSVAAAAQGLRLTGRLRSKPRPALQLALRARLPAGSATVRLAGRSDDVVLVSAGDGESVGSLAHAAHALSSVTTIEASGRTVMRIPRRLVVMGVDDRGMLGEIERVVLGGRHLLLVRDNLVERVLKALDGIARPGFKVLRVAQGVPSSWVLIRDVEVVALAEVKALDLDPLVPVGWSQMTLHDGFRLPGRDSWLASSPPELSLSVLQGGAVDVIARVGLATEDDIADDGEQVPAAKVLHCSVASIDRIDLAELRFDHGEYFFTAVRPDTDETVARAHAKLREPEPSALEHDFGHDTAEPLWPLSASPGGSMRGARLATVATTVAVPVDVELPVALGDDVLGDEETLEASPLPEVPEGEAPQCFLTGGHYFKLGDTTRKGTQGPCDYCGMEKFIPRVIRGGPGATKAVIRLPSLPALGESDDDDLLLGLSTAGAGSRGSLERMVEQVDDDPWALDERARTLSSLGHIDLRFDAGGRVAGWSVAPPVLVVDDQGDAVLCGWRSESLLEHLAVLSAELGGAVVSSPNEKAPSRVAVRDLDDTDLERIARDLQAGVGVELAVVTDAPIKLVHALPPARALMPELRESRGSGHDFQWLRPGSWAWDDVDQVRLPGAYRSRGLPRRSYVFDGQTLRSCEPRLARWLAVPAATPHLAYDPVTCTLTVPLGGRLPGLWERAAVLSSGRPPQRAGGRLVYRDVSPAVAERLAASLFTSTEGILVV